MKKKKHPDTLGGDEKINSDDEGNDEDMLILLQKRFLTRLQIT